jgi:hypothetical protein
MQEHEILLVVVLILVCFILLLLMDIQRKMQVLTQFYVPEALPISSQTNGSNSFLANYIRVAEAPRPPR